MRKRILFLLKLVFNILLGLVEFFTFYFIIAVVLSLVPYNSDDKTDKGEIEIFVLSNGMHTDIVLPAVNRYKDWTKDIKVEHTLLKDTACPYIAFGWGDKGFYLNTPRWSDLKFSTAFNAMFALGESAMHTTYYQNIRPGEHCKRIKLSKEAYHRLVKYIEDSFQKQENKVIHIKGHHYDEADSFYEARGSYNLFYTCNTWTNEALKQCGVKASLWTVFDKGVLYHCED